MKYAILLILLVGVLVMPASADEMTAPQPPEDASDLIPVESESFAKDLWHVVTTAFQAVQPELSACIGTCLRLILITMAIGFLSHLSGLAVSAVELTGVLCTALMLLQQTAAMIDLAADTVQELSEYGKLLLPAMTAALAGQGGVGTSTALYTCTVVFDAVLCALISSVLVPGVYVYICTAVAAAATGERFLEVLQEKLRGLSSWLLKTLLYIFTGYMGITGVVSGSADAAAVKAAKLTVSGMVPVVGGILSDTSEAVIVGAGLVKNTVGTGGVIALGAIWITPFLRIGIRYLCLKLTGTLCSVFGVKPVDTTINAFSSAMGLLLGMTGAVCTMLVISTVCFMKGMT